MSLEASWRATELSGACTVLFKYRRSRQQVASLLLAFVLLMPFATLQTDLILDRSYPPFHPPSNLSWRQRLIFSPRFDYISTASCYLLRSHSVQCCSCRSKVGRF